MGDAQADLLTVAEAAEILRIKDQTVRYWIRDGKLSASKNAAGYWRIPRAEVYRARGSLTASTSPQRGGTES